MGLLVACTFLMGCTNGSGLPSKGTGGSSHGGSAAGGTGGLGTGGGGGSTAEATMTGGTRSGSGGVAGGSGSSAGGLAGGSSGTGGATICPAIACLLPACPYGTLPSTSPCGCPTCAPPPDAGQTLDGPMNGPMDGPIADGPIVACGAATDPTCASGTHCEWSDKLCGSRTHGACASFPGGVLCAISAEPVCGCDGKNYASPCEAARAGVDISSNASCPEPAGLFRCGWSYCQHNVQYCHAQVGGAVSNPGSYVCNGLPTACGGVPSCACVAGNATICDTSANGDVTATLEVP